MFSHRSRINLQPLFYLEKISPFRTLRISPLSKLARSHVPAHKVSLLQRNKVERDAGAQYALHEGGTGRGVLVLLGRTPDLSVRQPKGPPVDIGSAAAAIGAENDLLMRRS